MPASGMSTNRAYDERFMARTTVLPEQRRSHYYEPYAVPAPVCTCKPRGGSLLILPAAIVIGSVVYLRRRKQRQK